MARRLETATLQRTRWRRALRIAALLFKEEGYHTTYLDEVEAFIGRADAPPHGTDAPPQAAPPESRYHVAHYPHSRFWAVYEGTDLVAVTAYRKGAQEVTARLEAQARTIATLQRQLAAMTEPPASPPALAAEPEAAPVANPAHPPTLLTAEDSKPYRTTSPRRRPASAPEPRP